MNRFGQYSLGLGLLCVVGCGSSIDDDPQRAVSALRLESASIASVEFTTSSSIPSNPPPAVHVTVSDATRAQSLYAATLALPVFPPGRYNCPADLGISYTLAFRDASGSTVMTANLDRAGCEAVVVASPGGSEAALWTATQHSYWSTLASDLGIAESAIYP